MRFGWRTATVTAAVLSSLVTMTFLAAPAPVRAADPPPAPAAQPAQTLFGTTASQLGGESFNQAVGRRDRDIAPLRILRIYNPGAPKAWNAEPAVATGRPLILSFKVNPGAINSGSQDAFFKQWFATAPRDRDIYWVYYHEPEDNIRDGEFTAAAYRTAFTRLDSLADQVGNPKLHTTQVLMEWTLDPSSHRNWRDYYPGKDVIDVQAWDTYGYDTSGKYISIQERQARRHSLEITQAEGNQFGIAEIGGVTRQGRPEWLRSVGQWARANHAAFVSYFDSTKDGNYVLDDRASQQAWGDVIRQGSTMPASQPSAPAAPTSSGSPSSWINEEQIRAILATLMKLNR